MQFPIRPPFQNMKARTIAFKDNAWQVCPIAEASCIQICIPGPTGLLTLPFIIKGSRQGTGRWSWNGDIEKPTLRPSVRTTSGHFSEGFTPPCWCDFNREHEDEKSRFKCFRCHCWVNDGRAIFLDDTTHEFKGQTLDLLDLNG